MAGRGAALKRKRVLYFIHLYAFQICTHTHTHQKCEHVFRTKSEFGGEEKFWEDRRERSGTQMGCHDIYFPRDIGEVGER